MFSFTLRRKLNKLVIFCFIALFFSGILLNSQPYLLNVPSEEVQNFYVVQKKFNEYWAGKEPQKGEGWKQFKRWEWFWEQRTFPTGEFPNHRELAGLFTFYKDNIEKYDKAYNVSWQPVGPSVVPTNRLGYPSSGAGRITCIRFNPTDENVIFVGSASGGIWKSTNGGSSWQFLNLTNFLSGGISDIAISPTNPNIVYAGTGDPNGVTMSSSYSIGVIKSTDGGTTWNITGLAKALNENFLVGDLFIHPNNPNFVIAATSLGIYKTTDGGQTWQVKQSGYFFRHLRAKLDNPNVLYASTYGVSISTAYIYLSVDGGETWTQQKAFSNTNRIALGVTPADYNYVYALCAKASTASYGGLYVSTDNGQNWTLKSSSPNILGINKDGSSTSGQAYYDLAIAVSPSNKDLIYAGGIHIWRSTDGGVTWKIMTHWTGDGYPYVHADQHDLIFGPKTGHLYSANDGGIYKTTNNGTSWVDLSNGLNIMQFYRLACSATNPNYVIGGAQDNGTNRYSNGAWDHVNGGDGMEAAVDPKNPNIVYSSIYNGYIERSTNGGLTFSSYVGPNNTGENGAWVTPFLLSPQNPSVMYVGYRNVWKISNGGLTRQKISNLGSSYTINALAVAPSDTNYVYAANANNLYATYDGGVTWSKLYTANSYITYIAVNPSLPTNIWITLSGYRPGEKVFEYKSSVWRNISGNLPNVPVNTIVYQPNSQNRIYIGTDIGVFYRDDFSGDWQSFNNGLPPVVVTELEFNQASGKLRAATFGNGIWEVPVINCNLPVPKLQAIGNTAFCSGDSVVLYPNNNYYSYKWSNGATTKQVVVKSTGIYFVDCFDEQGCVVRSDSISVEVYSVPNLRITGKYSNYFCENDGTELTASIGFSKYYWSTGDSTRKIFVTKGGDYYVRGITINNCERVSEIFTLTAFPNPAKPVIYYNGEFLFTDVVADSYQWLLNDEPIAGANASFYKPVEGGTYKVIAIDTANEVLVCTSVSEPYSFVSAINELEASQMINIYPNPAKGEVILHISNLKEMILEVEITNGLGSYLFRKLLNVNSPNYIEKLNLGDFADGLYFVIIKSKNFVKREKLIIIR